MKICYFYDYLGSGGSEIYGIKLSKELNKKGVETYIIYNKLNRPVDDITGVKLLQIPNKGTFDLSAAAELKKFFVREKIDIVHVPYPREEVLTVLAKILGAKVKIVRTYHRMDRFVFKSWMMEKAFGVFVSAYIAPTSFAAGQMESGGVSSRKITVIPNGVNPIQTREHLKAIGFLGRVEPEKGIYNIAKHWPTTGPKLVIAGDGGDTERIKVIPNSNIDIMGAVSDLPKFFEKISVLILPSLTETLPLSILEAYSSGVPVVVFDIPALQDIVNDATGARITTGDYKGLIDTAISLLDSAELNRKSAKAKKIFNEKYDISIVGQEVIELYTKTLS